MAPDDAPAGAGGSEPIGERVRLFRRGRTWYANFQHGGKQHRPSLRTASKKAALRLALRIEAELSAGQWKPAPVAATVEHGVAAYRDFLRTEGRAPKTLSKYESVFGRVIVLARQRGVRDLSGVDLKFVDAYRRMRADAGAADKTRYTETVVIRQLVNFALSRDMLAADPLKGLKLNKPKPTRQPCWRLDEVAAILAASTAEVRAALTLLAETGMRFGELAWLTWDDVDLTANLLRVRPKDGWTPKTGDQRVVPLRPTAKRVLEALPRQWRWVVTMPPTKWHPRPDRQWTERRLLTALKRVLGRLKLPGKLHTFRHAFTSNALLGGTSVAVVKEWVGHVDRQVIELYTHVHDSASQAAMQRLAEANRRLQQGGERCDHTEDGSAHNQHTTEVGRDGNDAK